MTTLRRPGSPWRLLVHEWTGKQPSGLLYGDSWRIDNYKPGESTATPIGDTSYTAHTQHIPGTEFDELVVGNWLHIEQQDAGHWWADIGGVTLLVTADRDGRPTHVTVYGPEAYADPVPGCIYDLTWTLPDTTPGETPT